MVSLLPINTEDFSMFKEKQRAQVLGGKLVDHGTYMDGYYEGYPITMCTESTIYRIRINAISANDPDNQQLAQYLEHQKQINNKLVDFSYASTAILLNVKMAMLGKDCPAIINGVVEPVIQYLLAGNYLPCCEYCGSTQEPLKDYEVNGSYHYFCSSCAQELQENFQQQQTAVRSPKSNLAAGLTGAFIGSLIGCVIWILLYRLGYIAAIAGAIAAICAMRGYELLGGHLDRKGIILSFLMMIVMIFFANRLAWSWDAYDALKSDGTTFSECYKHLNDILEASDLFGSYYADLAIGYVLSVCGSLRHVIAAFRTSNGSYRMKEVQK